MAPLPGRGRTISTEQGAWRTTARATLPNRKRTVSDASCEPTITKSAPDCAARSTTADLGSPASTLQVYASPDAFNCSAAYRTASSALRWSASLNPGAFQVEYVSTALTISI
jgi:hypothetical protein